MKVLGRLFLLLVVVGLLVFGWAYQSYQGFLAQPMSVALLSETGPGSDGFAGGSGPAGGTTGVLLIQRGQGYTSVVESLAAMGLVRERWHWWVLGRQNRLSGKIQAGEYAIPATLTPVEVLEYLAAGRVIQHSLTIVEGWRFKELRQVLSSHPALTQILTELPDQEVALRVDGDLKHPEGWFLPETYFFPRGTTDLELLQRAYRSQRQALKQIWAERQADLPLASPQELLTLASVVEKETGLAAERAKIAGVFVRRLELGMRLQTDPTVIYGLGDSFDGNLRRRDLRTDTPYNTYTRHGLPPTPIALPGLAALKAVAHPADGDTLYFVARGDGSHQFSATLDDHNRAVQRFQLKKSDKN